MHRHVKSFSTNQGNIFFSLFSSTATAPIYPKKAFLDSLVSRITLLLLLAPLFSQASTTACPALSLSKNGTCTLITTAGF